VAIASELKDYKRKDLAKTKNQTKDKLHPCDRPIPFLCVDDSILAPVMTQFILLQSLTVGILLATLSEAP